jgi:hypothetical protein
MPGRDVSIHTDTQRQSGSKRALAAVAATVALIGIGIAIGSRIAAPRQATQPHAVMTTTAAGSTSPAARSRRAVAAPTPTRAGAAAAAAHSITAFDGDVLLHPQRLRAVVARIASAESRAQLAAAFDEASDQTRAKLGAGTAPAPVIVLRSVPVGYRIERFSDNSARVAIWYVGIVGSGATVQPQQSWRTQIVSLVWENGAWKVSSFRSSAGPTPPLSTAAVPGSAGELFATIPHFQEFASAQP